jgi:acetyl-CoA C-acetyltransferase
MSERAVIVGVARTPQGKIQGQLSSFSAVELGVIAAKEAVARSGVSASDFESCLIGNVLQAGSGQNPARQVAINAGLPWSTVSTTINKLCLSGSSSVIDAARLISTGEANVVLAGGTESMSNAPHLLMGSRRGYLYGDVVVKDHTAIDGLTDAFDSESMGACTQRHSDQKSITRVEMDEYAAISHQRAGRAQTSGLFQDEIVPVKIIDRKGGETLVSTDEGVRPESTAESLGRLRPAFAEGGSITAGNASPISDGAAALVIVSETYAKAHGLKPLAQILGYGTVAGPDNSLLSQPSKAIEKALLMAQLKTHDIGHVEINEAFASVAIQSMRELGISEDIVNPDGGAIAIGHPIGASGARLVAHAAIYTARTGKNSVVGLCGGGGQGDAIVLGPVL